MKTEVTRLIGVNSVKYNILKPMIDGAFVGSTADTINIYVDLYSILKVLYSNIEIKLGEYNDLTASLVNIASHYRRFFRTRYRVESNIYFINSRNICWLNRRFYSKYNKAAEDSYNKNTVVNEYIENNLELFRTLVPCLPNVYLIDSEFETGVIIYDLMCRTDPNNNMGHMIITKESYNYQLLNMKPQTVILRTKRKDGSYLITRNNMFDVLFNERKVKTSTSIISPDLLTLLFALTGMKERGINTLYKINTAIKFLETAIMSNKIINGYNSDINYVYSNLDIHTKIDSTNFAFRFKCMDIQFQHSVFITTPEQFNINSYLIDRYDPEGVKEINNKYFITNPLDLNNL